MKWLPSRDYLDGCFITAVFMGALNSGVVWWKASVTACVVGCVFQWGCEAVNHIWRRP